MRGVSIAMPAQERTSADRWALGGNQFLVPDVEGGFATGDWLRCALACRFVRINGEARGYK